MEVSQAGESTSESTSTASTEQSASTTNNASASTPQSSVSSVAAKINAAATSTATPLYAPSSPDGTAPSATPTPYTPNFKFKVMDQEKEIDDFLKPIVKDAETEKKIRELYEKAHGLDFVKKGREKLQSDFESVRSNYTNLNKTVGTLTEMAKKNDFGSFFSNLGIDKDRIFRWVANELKYQELPADQRAMIENSRRAEDIARSREEESQSWRQRYEEASVQNLQIEMNHTLSRPDVQQVAEQFDARVGAGAFRSEVIKQGQWYFAVHKQHLPVEQAVQNVMKLIATQSPAMPAGGQPQVAQQAHTAVAPESVSQDKKPIIPNIQGRGTSPAKKTITGLKALKEVVKQKTAM